MYLDLALNSVRRLSPLVLPELTRLIAAKKRVLDRCKLKKDRNKGYFGRVLAAHGDQGRYEGNLSINQFTGSQRISLLFNRIILINKVFLFQISSAQWVVSV